MSDGTPTRRTAAEQIQALTSDADQLDAAGRVRQAAEVRKSVYALRQAETQRLRALAETQDEIAAVTRQLRDMSTHYPSATTLEELARIAVPARPLIERLAQLKGRAAILERSAA
jgi:hypothetical protein